jgi:apolipoprotein N-acyltransferase
MFKLFVEGGVLGMSLLTLELIAILLAAWKAPAWVKEGGLIALVTGVLWTLVGISEMAIAIHTAGDIAPGMVWAGLKVTIIPLYYCLFIYLASLIIRIVQKPRLL